MYFKFKLKYPYFTPNCIKLMLKNYSLLPEKKFNEERVIFLSDINSNDKSF